MDLKKDQFSKYDEFGITNHQFGTIVDFVFVQFHDLKSGIPVGEA